MQLQEVLYSQGFGTRRVCAGLVQQGLVAVQVGSSDVYTEITDSAYEVPEHDLQIRVQGVVWPVRAKAYVLLNKPAGTECSQKPSTYPSVYTLLPGPLRHRPTKSAVDGVQAVGRLDQDTTGMLLLSDDGQFIHRMSSPKKHVAKVYQVTTKHAVDDSQIERLKAGVILDDDPKPVRAADCLRTGEHSIDLVLTEGKYHQVKRMVAAVGNRVEALHRSQIGQLRLPESLLPGQWCWLSEADLALLK
ncbi:MAG: pseudouridine synthase [Hyphomicrobiales bacterium]|nr:MAG: pseudouridine synthase [Hyphomicrobiales bacterium]